MQTFKRAEFIMGVSLSCPHSCVKFRVIWAKNTLLMKHHLNLQGLDNCLPYLCSSFSHLGLGAVWSSPGQSPLKFRIVLEVVLRGSSVKNTLPPSHKSRNALPKSTVTRSLNSFIQMTRPKTLGDIIYLPRNF